MISADAWNRLMAPITRRLKLMVSRGVVKLVDAGALMQALQVEALKGEVLDGIEHFEPYGSTSHPLEGAEALLLSVGGRRSHSVAVVVADRRHRMRNLAPGEKAIHNHLGDYIVIRNGRIVEVVAGTKVQVTAPDVEVIASTKVTLTTPLTEISGDVTVAGALTAAGAIASGTSIADPTGTMAAMRGTYNGHTHPGGGVPDAQM